MIGRRAVQLVVVEYKTVCLCAFRKEKVDIVIDFIQLHSNLISSFALPGIVADGHCTKLSKNKHKERDRILRTCNEDPCPPDWWIGPWQPCPVTCQNKNEPRPIRRRSIMCSDQNEIALPDSRCADKKRPHDTEPCPGKLPNCRIDENNHYIQNKNSLDIDTETNNRI